MRIGIQGLRGSACHAAAEVLAPGHTVTYFPNALQVASALTNKTVTHAVLALESPVGTVVAETEEAFGKTIDTTIIREHKSEVRHVLLGKKDVQLTSIASVSSHAIPLRKHRAFLTSQLGTYHEIVAADTASAAQTLSRGGYPATTAVLALPLAGKLYDLCVLLSDLPANDTYLTRFVLIRG